MVCHDAYARRSTSHDFSSLVRRDWDPRERENGYRQVFNRKSQFSPAGEIRQLTLTGELCNYTTDMFRRRWKLEGKRGRNMNRIRNESTSSLILLLRYINCIRPILDCPNACTQHFPASC